jgi:iron(III) transport system substrate-binding protein
MSLSGLRVAAAALLTLLAVAPARAQLVIDGETISDAATFDAAKKQGNFSYFGVYPADQMKPILDAFKADTGISIDYVRLPGPTMFQRVTTEFAAKKLEADLVDVTDLGWVQQFIQLGIYTVPHKVPSFADIAPATRDDQGRWYSILRPVTTIGVNLSRVEAADVPKSWKDLLNPKFQGALGLADINGGGPFIAWSWLKEKIDPDYWKKLAALKPRIYPSVLPLATDLARGDVAVGIGAFAEQVIAQEKAGAPLKIVFPAEGLTVFPAAGGVVSTAKHPQAAALFLDWATSRRGGNVIARGGAYPANLKSNNPELLGYKFPPQSQVYNIPLDQLLETRERLTKEWRDTFGAK